MGDLRDLLPAFRVYSEYQHRAQFEHPSFNSVVFVAFILAKITLTDSFSSDAALRSDEALDSYFTFASHG